MTTAYTGIEGLHAVSPYTTAMARCVEGLGAKPTQALSPQATQQLINTIQGRMLEYLAGRICEANAIKDPRSCQQVTLNLLNIFSDEFFALFRSKIRQDPSLLLLIARRIIRAEAATNSQDTTPNDRLFPAIFRKYFEYRNLDLLLKMIESDFHIQKIILVVTLRENVRDTYLLNKICTILDEDQEGICPNLFMAYLKQNNLPSLLERIESGEWRRDMARIKQQLEDLRGGT